MYVKLIEMFEEFNNFIQIISTTDLSAIFLFFFLSFSFYCCFNMGQYMRRYKTFSLCFPYRPSCKITNLNAFFGFKKSHPGKSELPLKFYFPLSSKL